MRNVFMVVIRFIQLFIFVSFLHTVDGVSQPIKRGNIWYFGIKAGIDFSTNPPTVLYDGKVDNLFARSSTISDENGRMIFYTDGVTVWNKDNQIMQNGDDLTPGQTFYSIPSIIVPDPRDSRLYYIFTSNSWNGPTQYGLHYTTVDVSANAGSGAVVQKYIDLLNPATQILCSVNHANAGYWIIGHEWATNRFFAYHISETGVSVPVVSVIGSIYSSFAAVEATQMSVSPDGTMLAVAAGGAIELFDFNSNRGEITNFRTLRTDDIFLGVSFSPNSSLLYASSGYDRILQFDLAAGTIDEINASGMIIGEVLNNALTDLQLASNGELYCGRGGGLGGQLMIAIHNPDIKGKNCNFDDYALYVPNGDPYGLPTAIQSIYREPLRLHTTTTCQDSLAHIVISSLGYADSILWDYGDSSTKIFRIPIAKTTDHIYKQPGTYQLKLVKYIGGLAVETDTSFQIQQKPSVDLGSDTTLCEGQILTLSGGMLPSYNWSTGVTTPEIQVGKTGDYSLTASTAICTNSDTINVKVLQYPARSLQDVVSCEDYVDLSASQNSEYSYVWSTGESVNKISVDKTGLYSVKISNKQCSIKDSANVSFEYIRDFIISPQNYVSEDSVNTSIDLISSGSNVDSWHWFFGDGTNEETNTPETSHKYIAGSYSGKVVATNKWSCSAEATFSVEIPFLEFIPNIVTLDGNGKNEVFRIIYTGDTSNYNLVIYDRYGKQVFSTRDPLNYWTASEVSSGIYYFDVALGKNNRKGWVQVVK